MSAYNWKRADIVKRLRSGIGQWTDSWHGIVHPDGTMREAADEIERLREENKRLRQHSARVSKRLAKMAESIGAAPGRYGGE